MKRQYNIILWILINVVYSCNSKPQKELVFKIPEIINTQELDTNDIYRPRTKYNGEYPLEVMRFTFNDTLIDLNPEVLIKDSTREIGYIDIGGKWEEYKEFIDSSHFELISDYDTDIYLKYNDDVSKMYPVYVVNTSRDTFLYASHSTYRGGTELFKDPDFNKWVGIESVGSSSFNFCGCCAAHFIMPPKSYLILLFPKHLKGDIYDFKVKIWSGGSESPVFQAYLDTSLYYNGVSSTGEIVKRLKSERKY